MSKDKLDLDDIFNDDLFGKLEAPEKQNTIKTEDQRLIDSFEEINTFVEKHNREPQRSSMSEYSLLASLKDFRDNEDKKRIVKPYDKFNLLGDVVEQEISIDDILNDDLGILDTNEDLDIFRFKHTPKNEDRAKSDFIAKRKPIKEKDFKPYEELFHQVHKELKEGRRKILPFKNNIDILKAGRYYISNGVLLYLENIDYGRKEEKLSENTLRRKDGRTRIIFENGTESNMLFRSLGKNLHNGGKMITELDSNIEEDLYKKSGILEDDDKITGWIYALKTQSNLDSLSQFQNLYKIGFSSTPVKERIKGAKNEGTYLFSGVKIASTWQAANIDAHKLEGLLHRFFAECCINIEIECPNEQVVRPREWFDVPLTTIDTAISLIQTGTILNYEYDKETKAIVLND